MKRLLLATALMALTVTASAQTVNVQSAISDLKKGYLSKAKESIDKACKHEKTMNEAKTWCYAGLIYAQIGGESSNPKSKYKDLAPDWCQKAYDAALRCKELDKDNDYADNNNTVFRFVGNEYYTQAVAAFNEKQDYAQAMKLSEEAIKIFGNSGDKKFADDAYYLAGLSAKVMKDNESLLKFFNPLIRHRTNKKEVYQDLFALYKAEGKTEEAMKIANSFLKNCPEDYNSYLLMADGYNMVNNTEKSKEMLDQALAKSKGNNEVYTTILAAAAEMLENSKDYAGAEAKYKESLEMTPTQFPANFGMGKMLFNRAVDKLDAANEVPFDDETGLSDKLNEEAKDFFGQAVPYFKSAVSYIDGLNKEQQRMQRKNLYDCLVALKSIYARLENGDELKVVNARINEIQSQQ